MPHRSYVVPINSSLVVYRFRKSANIALVARRSPAYFATPSVASKQSANCLLCLFEAWSVSIFWLVVLWKVWKQVLHFTLCAAAF
jgi:hypothetical protein